VAALWRSVHGPDTLDPAGPGPGAVQPDVHGETAAPPAGLARPGRTERASVAAPLENFALDHAVWIEGRVELRNDVVLELGQNVVALAGRPDDVLVERADVSLLLDVLARGTRELWVSQRPLARDGSFRVPLPAAPPGSLVASLRLDGCYLALAPPPRFDPQVTRSIELQAAPGAWVLGRVLPPAGAPTTALHGRDVRLSGWRRDGGGLAFETVGRLDGALRFEFRGVPVGHSPFFNFDPVDFPPVSEAGWQLVAGEAREYLVTLEPGASVRGRVSDGQGTPLAGVTIEESRLGAGFVLAANRRATTSDGAGAFELRGLSAGTQRFSARQAGRRPKEVTIAPLAAGETRTEVEIELEVGAELAGSVVWPDGSPAAHAAVRVRPAAAARRSRFERDLASATTDVHGRFYLSGLGQGPFHVSAVCGLPDAGEESLEREGLARLFKARAQSVAAGALDLVLELEQPEVLRGRVVDDRGRPVPAFRIHASERPAPADGDAPTFEESITQEFRDEGGWFELAGVMPGAWTVSASAAGHVETAHAGEVRVPQLAGLELTLLRAATVHGHVVSPGGAAAAGAEVRAERVQGSGSLRYVRTLCDEGGAFTLAGLPPGSVAIVAEAAGLAPSEPSILTLDPGEERSGVLVALSLGGRLEGLVYAPSGEPDAGRSIHAVDLLESSAALPTTTGPDGRFALDQLRPGTYQVLALPRASEAGTLSSPLEVASVEIRANETTQVVLGEAGRTSVRLFGRVTEGGRAVARCHVVALAEGAGMLESMQTGSTDESGAYELVLERPGDYALLVGHGSEGIERRIHVPAAPEFRHDVELPSAAIEGTITGPDAEPLAVPLWLSSESATSALSRMTGGVEGHSDARGIYRFANLEPGTYTLRAQPLGTSLGAVVQGGIALAEGQLRRGVDLVLPEGGTLTGTVRGADGAPVAGATIFVRDASGQPLDPVSTCTSDGEGRFRCSGVPAGRVTASARAGRFASAESAVLSVPAGGAASVALTLGRGTLLVVAVTDETGAAVHARVRVSDAQAREWSDLLGRDGVEQFLKQGLSAGEHRLGPLPPGAYTVRAVDARGLAAEDEVTLDGRERASLTLRIAP
jgi:protocatechuate 3,4-dioxygenase beta subunit